MDTRRDTRTALDREVVALCAVVVLGTIMTVLDLTIVNVAVPTLGRTFDASVSTIQWVMTGYMLAFAAAIPLTGWATERFGAKRVWLISLFLFVAASALAGAAWSIGALIAFRVLQGVGAGMILPVGQTILAQAAGPQRMGRVMSVIGVPLLLGPILGNVLGGAIVDQVSWRWIFYVNVPVGIAAIAAALRLLPDARPRGGQRLDVRGLVLLSPGIAVFLYGMSAFGNGDGRAGTRTLALVAAGVALVALYVRHAVARGAGALIDVSLFRRRAFATAAALNVLLMIALFGSLLLLPLYYQLVRHETPLHVGLLLVPQGVGAALAMPLAGQLTDRIGARAVVAAGSIIAALGTLAFTQLGARTSYLYLGGALLVVGLGIGGTIAPSMAAVFQTVGREEVPRATAALNAIQRVAGAVGTALLAVVLQRSIAADVGDVRHGLDGVAAVSNKPHAAALVADAFGRSFWVAAALIAAALLPALLLPRLRPLRQEPELSSTTEASA